MGWANFLVMRRTHATLMSELGVSGKLIADHLGHSLDVNQNVYTQSPVENRLPAVNQLGKKPVPHVIGAGMEQRFRGLFVSC